MLQVSNLTGFGARQSPVTAFSFFASAIVDGPDIVMPTGVARDDVAVLCDWAADLTLPTSIIPAGWTALVQATDSSFRRLNALMRQLDGSESGVTLTGMTGLFAIKTILVFRPNGAVSNLYPSTWLSEITGGNPSAQTIAASGQPKPAIALAVAAQQGFGGSFYPAAFSVGSFDATVQSVATGGQVDGASTLVGYTLMNASPADLTVDKADQGQNGLISGYLRAD